MKAGLESKLSNKASFNLTNQISYPEQSETFNSKHVVYMIRDSNGFGLQLKPFSNNNQIAIAMYITQVEKNSPADLAKLQIGDRLLSVNNRSIENLNIETIVQILKYEMSKEEVVFCVVREHGILQSSHSLDKIIESVNNKRGLIPKVVRLLKTKEYSSFGLHVEADIEFGHVISKIVPDSPAGRSSIQCNDVIIQFGDDVILHMPFEVLKQKLQSHTIKKVSLSVVSKKELQEAVSKNLPIITSTEQDISINDNAFNNIEPMLNENGEKDVRAVKLPNQTKAFTETYRFSDSETKPTNAYNAKVDCQEIVDYIKLENVPYKMLSSMSSVNHSSSEEIDSYSSKGADDKEFGIQLNVQQKLMQRINLLEVNKVLSDKNGSKEHEFADNSYRKETSPDVVNMPINTKETKIKEEKLFVRKIDSSRENYFDDTNYNVRESSDNIVGSVLPSNNMNPLQSEKSAFARFKGDESESDKANNKQLVVQNRRYQKLTILVEKQMVGKNFGWTLHKGNGDKLSVEKVDTGSSAENAGFKASDQLIYINSLRVDHWNGLEAEEIFNRMLEQKNVEITIKRYYRVAADSYTNTGDKTSIPSNKSNKSLATPKSNLYTTDSSIEPVNLDKIRFRPQKDLSSARGSINGKIEHIYLYISILSVLFPINHYNALECIEVIL
ncbi:hypothetical protein GJ496_002790 [Pomphorhynchus laevis]|nr:hypothetical protein GJ496_002790 [Pomphorhynchus laevis]